MYRSRILFNHLHFQKSYQQWIYTVNPVKTIYVAYNEKIIILKLQESYSCMLFFYYKEDIFYFYRPRRYLASKLSQGVSENQKHASYPCKMQNWMQLWRMSNSHQRYKGLEILSPNFLFPKHIWRKKSCSRRFRNLLLQSGT